MQWEIESYYTFISVWILNFKIALKTVFQISNYSE